SRVSRTHLLLSMVLTSGDSLFFFSHDTPPPQIYTLSLHDALPISRIHHTTRQERGPAPLPLAGYRPGYRWRRTQASQAAHRSTQRRRQHPIEVQLLDDPDPPRRQAHQRPLGEHPTHEEMAEMALDRGSLGSYLDPRPFHGPTERDQARAHRLTSPAMEAEAHDVDETLVDLELARGDRAHRHQPATGGGGVESGQPVSRAVRQTQAALHAGGQLGTRGMEIGHPSHHRPPGSRPGSRIRQGSNAAMTRRWRSRSGGGLPHGS